MIEISCFSLKYRIAKGEIPCLLTIQERGVTSKRGGGGGGVAVENFSKLTFKYQPLSIVLWAGLLPGILPGMC